MKSISTWASVAAAVFLALGAANAHGQSNKKVDLTPKDTRSYSQKEQDHGFAEAKKGYEHLQREKEAERMRDTRHDGRLKTGKDSSLGGGAEPPNINWKTTTK